MNAKAFARPEQSVIENNRFDIAARYSDRDLSVTSLMRSVNPAAWCLTQAEKLHALTYLLNGEGFDVFDCAADEIKRNTIWLLADLAKEVMVLAALAHQVSDLRDGKEICRD